MDQSHLINISDDESAADAQHSARQVLPSKQKVKRETPVKQELSGGFKEEDEYNAMRRRMQERRKKRLPNKSGTPAKRGRPRNSTGKENAKGRKRRAVTLDSGSDSCSEDDLPEYIRTRRKTFDENCQTLQEAGLRLPPSYSDIYFSDDEDMDKLEEKPKFDEMSCVKPSRPYADIVLKTSGGIIPASIAQYLRDYQIDGVEFLHRQFIYQLGGVLADDMGLGKTVQVAAFLTAAFGKTGDQRDAKRMRKFRRTKDDWYPRAMIICPGSLIQNWKNELDRWGWWEVDVFHGSGKDDVLGAARAGRLEVMITTYSTYRNSSDDINRVPWDVVVADECHAIKEVKAEVTKTMNKVNSLCRIGLTGTAIQNRYEELWTLLNWTNPERFGTRADWKKYIGKPLTIGQSHDATAAQLSLARKTAKNLVNNLLPRFFLRRTKKLIAHQLPKKSDKVVFCSLSDYQREAYENVLASEPIELVLSAFGSCPCGSAKKRGFCCFKADSDGESWKALVFPIIMTLQKLSNHFNLIIPRVADVADKHAREMKFLKAAMPDTWEHHYRRRDSLLELANPEYCGKWKVLRKLLEFWHRGSNKVLVFSHSVRLLRILQQLFNNTRYNVSYLDGAMGYEERQNVVDDFNSDPNQFIFLISTKAGGVGLNITSANKVVIMDPHWNPAYDLQAQDRAYRIGQVRDVDVYRLISTGTIEEITYARQIYKQQQANIGYTASNERRYYKGVQGDVERKGEIFGIRNLLTYNGNDGLLRDIVNKTNIAEAKAGVRLVDIDMNKDPDDDAHIKTEEGGDDDTGGLKQLSSLLTREDNKNGSLDVQDTTKSKVDPIQSILASVGVEYTHENSEVVASSKIEDELSRRAQMAPIQNDGTSRALFFDSQAAPAMMDFDYEYNPPEDVMRRQFCTMAQTFGFPNATDFALIVAEMRAEDRRNCLDLFYKKRAEKLNDIVRETDQGATADVKLEVMDDAITVDDEAETEVAETEYSTASEMIPQPVAQGAPDNTSSNVNGQDAIVNSAAAQTDKHSIWVSDDDDTDEL